MHPIKKYKKARQHELAPFIIVNVKRAIVLGAVYYGTKKVTEAIVNHHMETL